MTLPEDTDLIRSWGAGGWDGGSRELHSGPSLAYKPADAEPMLSRVLPLRTLNFQALQPVPFDIKGNSPTHDTTRRHRFNPVPFRPLPRAPY